MVSFSAIKRARPIHLLLRRTRAVCSMTHAGTSSRFPAAHRRRMKLEMRSASCEPLPALRTARRPPSRYVSAKAAVHPTVVTHLFTAGHDLREGPCVQSGFCVRGRVFAMPQSRGSRALCVQDHQVGVEALRRGVCAVRLIRTRGVAERLSRFADILESVECCMHGGCRDHAENSAHSPTVFRQVSLSPCTRCCRRPSWSAPRVAC